MNATKLPILAIALFCTYAAPACVIVSDDDDHHQPPPPVADQPYYTTIDADFVLDTNLGEGAGMFVEYGVGGRWNLWTSCDTLITGSLCIWDVRVTALSGGIYDLLEFDTEDYDYTEYLRDNSLVFYAETGSDSDAVEFYTEPGTLLEVELALDGWVAPEYLVWYGNDTVHNGAPRSPVVFQPDQP